MPSYFASMDKAGHYGGNAAPDAYHGSEDSAGGSFALDFAGMLDAADGVLHQQIYEYLQGPAVQQPDHQLLSSSVPQDQGPGFPGPAQLYAGTPSFPALSPFQTSSMAEPLRGHANFEYSSLPQLSRRDSGFEYPRKESSTVKAEDGHIGSSSAMEVPLGVPMGGQMYSTDVFHPPVQSNLVFNAREFSGYGASCSPNAGHVKPSAGGESDIILSSRTRGRKAQKVEPGQEIGIKLQRPAEQAEHIIRERQRRDDMTSKFLMLESLLPPGPKRDRSTVVEDSIEYVKSLHHRLKALQEKRSKMKSNAISSRTTVVLKHKPAKKDQKQGNPATVPKGLILNPVTSSPTESNALAKSGGVEKIEVHLDLPNQIVIEMTCRPHRHIQSQIMTALERLSMDVSRCSISKLQNCLICVIVVKPRVMTEPEITGDDVIGALKRAIVPD